MREISTRLEEMPAEEGYPAYLAARIAAFYERAASAQCLGRPDRSGNLSIIGAVSPPGGDLSDSVVQATLAVVKVFWSLQGKLAYQRHFPAIDWLSSYSFYKQYLPGCFEDKDRGRRMEALTARAMALLEQESELREIVRLVGAEALSASDRLTLETARSIREDFLHQNAFHEVDTYSPIGKQLEMLDVIMHFHDRCGEAIEANADVDELLKLPVREQIARAKYIGRDGPEKISAIRQTIDEQIKKLRASAAS
jgi:V/A-type H+-transporting ATPase subunit A